MGDDDIGPNEYRCSACGGIFENGWSDEEALAESKKLWPGVQPEECVEICDDCNVKFLAWARNEGLIPNA